MMQTPREKVYGFMKRYGMDSESIDIPESIRAFLTEMEAGLEGNGSLSMIPTYIGEIEQLPAGKPVIVLDVGGTHLRVAVIRFDKNLQPDISDFSTRPMPGSLGEITKDEFFNKVADYVEPVLDKSDVISICFSFGTIPQPDKDGIIFEIGKQLRAKGLVGCKIAQSLREVLAKRGVGAGKRFVVLNDAVATLLGGMVSAGGRQFDDYVGFVLGTGANTSYFEQTGRIPKINYPQVSGRFIINTESGDYDKFRRGVMDLELDERMLDPGKWKMEKMVSGKYQGGLLMQTLRKAAESGILCEDFGRRIQDAEDLRSFEIDEFLEFPFGQNRLASFCGEESENVDDRKTVFYLIDELTERMAKILTVNLSALLIKTGKGKNPCLPVCISWEGSTLSNSRMIRSKLEYYMKKHLSYEMGIYYEFVRVENSTLIGSAVAGFAT